MGELFGGNLNITWDGKSVVLSKLVTLRFHCSKVQAAKPLLQLSFPVSDSMLKCRKKTFLFC